MVKMIIEFLVIRRLYKSKHRKKNSDNQYKNFRKIKRTTIKKTSTIKRISAIKRTNTKYKHPSKTLPKNQIIQNPIMPNKNPSKGSARNSAKQAVTKSSIKSNKKNYTSKIRPNNNKPTLLNKKSRKDMVNSRSQKIRPTLHGRLNSNSSKRSTFSLSRVRRFCFDLCSCVFIIIVGKCVFIVEMFFFLLRYKFKFIGK
jgi:hypothetical protein